jgi:cell division protein ZapA (FtsZ GTPase activity inhibitor)
MSSQTSGKQQVKVNILNQPFTLVTSGDPQDTVNLAAEVDDLMNGIAMRSQNLDSTRVAVLAALHLADQLRDVQQQLMHLQTSVREKSRRLSELLDGIEE